MNKNTLQFIWGLLHLLCAYALYKAYLPSMGNSLGLIIWALIIFMSAKGIYNCEKSYE